MSSSLSQKEYEFLKKLIMRGVNDIVMRSLEVVSRFAQYRLRELAARGIGIVYDIGINQEKDGIVLRIAVRIPDWWLEEQIAKRSRFVTLLRRMQYNIRRAESYMYGWPVTDRELVAEAVALLEEGVVEEGGAGGEGGERGEAVEEVKKSEADMKIMRRRVEIEIEGFGEIETGG